MGRPTGGRPVDAEAGDEVIDKAANTVNRDALHFRPGGAIGGGSDHDIVGPAAILKAAVFPDDVHLTRRVNFGRRERYRRANALWNAEVYLRDLEGGAPA